MNQTIERNRLQLAALFKLYVSTMHVRANMRAFGQATTEEDYRLMAIRAALRTYVKALRTGVACPFQNLPRMRS